MCGVEHMRFEMPVIGIAMHDTADCIESQEPQESENCRRQTKKCRVRSRLFCYLEILQGTLAKRFALLKGARFCVRCT